MCIKLNVCCLKFEAHYLHRAAKFITADPAQYVALLYSIKLCYYGITKLACCLTCILTLSVPTVDFNKTLIDLEDQPSLHITYVVFINMFLYSHT